MNQPELKENTWLIDRFFPMNVFANRPSGSSVLALHWHDSIEIIHLLQGRAVFTLQGRSYSCKPGDILFVNSGLLHSGNSLGEEPVVYQAIVFHKTLLSSATPDPYHAKYVQPFLENKRLFPELTTAADPGHSQLKAALDLLLEEFGGRRAGYELAVKAALHLMVLAVYRNYPEESTGGMDMDRLWASMDRFKELLEYIDQHSAQRLTVAQAARIVALSPAHFSKVFKKLTGRTLVEFMNLTRVEKAAELLVGTDIPVTEIAGQTGFCNINYFDKVFKAAYNRSPTQIRRDNIALPDRTI